MRLYLKLKYSRPNIDEDSSTDNIHQWVADHIIIYLKDQIKTEDDIKLYQPLLDLCFAKKGSINYYFDEDGSAQAKKTSALAEALKAPHSAYAKMIL